MCDNNAVAIFFNYRFYKLFCTFYSFGEKKFISTKLLNEVPLCASVASNKKLPLLFWNISGRLQWFFNIQIYCLDKSLPKGKQYSVLYFFQSWFFRQTGTYRSVITHSPLYAFQWRGLHPIPSGGRARFPPVLMAWAPLSSIMSSPNLLIFQAFPK